MTPIETPRARFVRTFLTLLAGAAVTWKGIDWLGDWKTGITVVAWGLVTITIASALAALAAARDWLKGSTSPLLRALASFLEVVVAGIPVVAITGFADLVSLERIVITTLGIAIAGAIGALSLNSVNPLPTTTPAELPPAA